MIKNLLVLLVFTIVLNSCGDCPDDCCIGDPCFVNLDSPGTGDTNSTFNTVTISNICEVAHSDLIYREAWFNCEDFKKLDYINNPPQVCEEITLTDSNGESYTGLFVSIRQDPDCK